MPKSNDIKTFFIKYKHIINYFLFGAITIFVSFASYWLCYDILRIPNLISNAISWIAAVTVSFISSKIWVFNSKTWTVKIVIPEIVKFVGVRFFTFIFEEIIMGITVDLLHYNGLLMKFITGIGAITLNYIFSRIWVFRKNGQFARNRNQSMTQDMETHGILEK
ncbi:MAG: GtrA family protein [Prevotellaceae bacterium]|nr:GtrA family protein [Candidatus Faecinaster equi]